MDNQTIMSLVTVVITLIFGIIAKKIPKYSNKLIPIQNIVIGVTMAIINYIFTKDLSLAITVSGLTAGGMYDIVSNLNKLIKENKETEVI